MAAPKTLRGTKVLIKVGDGEDPEVFAHPCLINADRAFSVNAETNEQLIPDCTDPDLLAWVSREKRSVSAAVSGAGMLDTTDVEDFFAWVSGADTRNVRVELNGVAAVDGGGYWAGAFHLVTFEVSGSRGNKAECSIALASDGAVTWTDAS